VLPGQKIPSKTAGRDQFTSPMGFCFSVAINPTVMAMLSISKAGNCISGAHHMVTTFAMIQQFYDEIWNSFIFLQRSQQECNTTNLHQFLVPEAIRDYGAWLPLFHQYSLQHAHVSVVGINTVSLSGVCE
jgi:hypothetical protein